MAFYSLVPFENEVYLIRATDSQALDTEDLQKIDEAMKGGKSLDQIQDTLENVWNK